MRNSTRYTQILLALIAIASLTVWRQTAQAQNCDQPCQPDMQCIGAYTAPPPAHAGPHTCGGTFTMVAHDGSCDTGTSQESCDLGDATIVVGTYSCTSNGSSCLHTLISTSNASVCDC